MILEIMNFETWLNLVLGWVLKVWLALGSVGLGPSIAAILETKKTASVCIDIVKPGNLGTPKPP